MPPLPPVAIWLIAELAIACMVLAIWWGLRAARLHRRHVALREDVERHLQQVADTLGLIQQSSNRLHAEVERLFSDPENQVGLRRLDSIRALLTRQKADLAQRLAGAPTARALLSDAMPSIRRAIEGLEEDLSTLIRQWDSAISETQEQLATVQVSAEDEAQLLSLRGEHEALQKMHATLVTAHQESTDRMAQLERELAACGAEAERAAAAGARPDATDRAPDEAEVDRLREALESAGVELQGLREAHAAGADDLASAREEVARLQAALEESASNEGALNRMQDRIDQLEQQNNELLSANALLLQVEDESVSLSDLAFSTSGDEPTDDLEIARDRIQALEDEVERLSQELESNRLAMAAGAADIETVSSSPERLAGGEAASPIIDDSGAIAALRIQLLEANEKMQAMSEHQAAAQARIEELLSQLDISQASVDDMAASRKLAQQQLTETREAFEQKIARMEADVRQARIAMATHSSDDAGKLEEALKRIADIESQLEISQATAEDMAAGRKLAQQQLAETRESYEKKFEKMEAEMRLARRKAQGGGAGSADLAERAADLEQEMAKQKSYVESLVEQNRAQDDVLQKQMLNIKRLQEELKSMETENVALKKQLARSAAPKAE